MSGVKGPGDSSQATTPLPDAQTRLGAPARVAGPKPVVTPAPPAKLERVATHKNPAEPPPPNGGATAKLPAPRDTPPADRQILAAATTSRPSDARPYDIANISSAAVDALCASKDVRTHLLGLTIRNAKLSYADYLRNGARIVVTTSAGNGGYPVLVLVGPKFDARQGAVVHTHYHGFGCTVTDSMGDSGRSQVRMREVQQRLPQVVFVLPECRNADKAGALTTETRSYQTDWSNVGSQAKTTGDALAAVGITDVTKRVVSAHSGGGQAIANAIRRDRSGAGLQADELELLDCLYGCQGAVATWAKTNNGKAVQKVYYVRGENEPGRDRAFPKTFGSRFERIDARQDGRADNPYLLDADGQPYLVDGAPLRRIADARKWHTRARGEFMHVAGTEPKGSLPTSPERIR